MNDDEQRALRACTDVLAVEETAPGMVRVVALTDAYVVDARGDGCYCPDKEYHEPPMCKHDYAAVLSDTDLPTPFMVVENVDERTDPAFDLEVPDRIGKDKQLTAFADGGTEPEYRRHDIELRDVREDHILVSYNAILDCNATYTEGRHVHSKLPRECLVLFEDGTLDVSELSDDEREWLQFESEQMSNEIDFAGTENGAKA